MDDSSFQQNKYLLLLEIGYFVYERDLGRYHRLGQFRKACKGECPGLTPFVQIANGLVVIENDDMRVGIEAGVNDQAEVKISMRLHAPLFQLCFRQFDSNLEYSGKFAANGLKHVIANFFPRHASV